jgi:hypothetical protein
VRDRRRAHRAATELPGALALLNAPPRQVRRRANAGASARPNARACAPRRRRTGAGTAQKRRLRLGVVVGVGPVAARADVVLLVLQ